MHSTAGTCIVGSGEAAGVLGSFVPQVCRSLGSMFLGLLLAIQAARLDCNLEGVWGACLLLQLCCKYEAW